MTDGFGKYDVRAVAGSAYCYKDTTVLRNKFGIRDPILLRKIEADISVARQTDLMAHPISGRFTASHLCAIHRYLLGDVYAFAGYLRREDIAKGETRFLAHTQIKEKLTRLLDELRDEDRLCGMARSCFITRSAYYLSELNYIHPFREGNGRAIREFMRLLFLHNGYKVDWGAVSVDKLMAAMVDSVYDIKLLEHVLSICLYNSGH